ncbi:MAG: hypothetical protein OJJ54_04440 [Pseudonocardia sp.]|nr:hypothetical protein [Pseudonocardia sp.]
MYGKIGTTAFLALPAGSLAVSGLGVLWYVVAGCTVAAATLALARLLPRREE